MPKNKRFCGGPSLMWRAEFETVKELAEEDVKFKPLEVQA
jgi:hypothetical protein